MKTSNKACILLQTSSFSGESENYRRISLNYEGNRIEFRHGSSLMINATEMARPFGEAKKPNFWLRNQQTKEFLTELSKLRICNLTDLQRYGGSQCKSYYGGLILGQHGGCNPGTWMHEDVALEFARWLSPKFAIWCNDQIKQILLNNPSIHVYKQKLATENDLKLMMSNFRIHLQEKSEQRKIALFGKSGVKCTDIMDSFPFVHDESLEYNLQNCILPILQNNTMAGYFYLSECNRLDRDNKILKNALQHISDFLSDKFDIIPR